MNYNMLEIAFASLLHDIGKFYQRTKNKSDLTAEELIVTPISKKANYHTHLHSGYTSRFFKKYLKIESQYEFLTSAHHLSENDKFAEIIRKGDRIASAIDRNDELFDYQENNNKSRFQQVRMSSVMSDVNLGKEKHSGKFELTQLSKMKYPCEELQEKSKEASVEEYSRLFASFVREIENDTHLTGKIDRYLFDRLYALLYEYTTFIPASTYEGNTTYVSLFDHLKLSSAISSCLYLNGEKEEFCMLEFDVSGIQKFIFKITEGKDTKKEVAKSLRGRSLFVSLITNMITYSFLNEFGLTQSNIIFNTGGGALLLIPCCKNYEVKIKNAANQLIRDLYELFGTDLSFVYSYVLCDAKELEMFKTEKAVELKRLLEIQKSRKLSGIIAQTFVEKVSTQRYVCKMCGTNLVDEDNSECIVCKKIKEMSDLFVNNDRLYLVYDFHNHLKETNLHGMYFQIGSGRVYIINDDSYLSVIGKYDYIESINVSKLGNTRYIANMVPRKDSKILNFEEISSNLLTDDYGDKKLGILKMDVDNLGMVFAFGLSESRSLSKFLTLSRHMEIFFSKQLIDICLDVSRRFKKNMASDNESLFYINYAGGDDLVIIGPIAAILELANEINNKFNQYTLNKNITISGGIHIQNSKEPIRFGIKMAERGLTESKLFKGKNSITLLDVSCKFNEFEQILERMYYFKSMIENNYISRTTFYNLMQNINVCNYDDYLKRVPIIFYSLKRNVSDENKRIELVREFSLIKNIKELNKLVLQMKLAVMQTRGE